MADLTRMGDSIWRTWVILMEDGVDRYTEQMIRLRQTLTSALKVKPRSILGFSTEEIGEVQRRFGFPVPAAYQAYLQCFGHANGGLLCDGQSTWSSVSQLIETSDLREFAETALVVFPQQLIVVYAHQGYLFDFIDATEGDNPPVYRWQEGDRQVGRAFWSFTAYLASAIDWAISHPKDGWLNP